MLKRVMPWRGLDALLIAGYHRLKRYVFFLKKFKQF
jgi:hypothetical protein